MDESRNVETIFEWNLSQKSIKSDQVRDGGRRGGRSDENQNTKQERNR